MSARSDVYVRTWEILFSSSSFHSRRMKTKVFLFAASLRYSFNSLSIQPVFSFLFYLQGETTSLDPNCQQIKVYKLPGWLNPLTISVVLRVTVIGCESLSHLLGYVPLSTRGTDSDGYECCCIAAHTARTCHRAYRVNLNLVIYHTRRISVFR